MRRLRRSDRTSRRPRRLRGRALLSRARPRAGGLLRGRRHQGDGGPTAAPRRRATRLHETSLIGWCDDADLRIPCPNGHLLEVFHRMSDPSPTNCEVCGALRSSACCIRSRSTTRDPGSTRPTTAGRTQGGQGRRLGGLGLVGTRRAGRRSSSPAKSPPAARPAAGRRRDRLPARAGRRYELGGEAAEPSLSGWPVGSRARRWSSGLRRRQAVPHREDAGGFLAGEQHRGSADLGGIAAEPAVERVRAGGAELHPAELENCRREVGGERFIQRASVEGQQRSVENGGQLRRRGLRHGLLARLPGQVVLGRVELVLADPRVDQRPLAVHVLDARMEAPALPRRQRACVG